MNRASPPHDEDKWRELRVFLPEEIIPILYWPNLDALELSHGLIDVGVGSKVFKWAVLTNVRTYLFGAEGDLLFHWERREEEIEAVVVRVVGVKQSKKNLARTLLDSKVSFI